MRFCENILRKKIYNESTLKETQLNRAFGVIEATCLGSTRFKLSIAASTQMFDTLTLF